MGNRILKESITTSKQINALTYFEEALFYRLITTVDDYGIYHADPVLLAHVLYPAKGNITSRMVEKALDHLEQVNLIFRYTVEDKGVFLKLVTWEKHQRLRTTRRKYPAPPGTELPEKNTAAGADPGTQPRTEPDVLISLPLNDGTEYPVTQKTVDEFALLYPSVNILQELRAMRGWCLCNEKKRKAKSGIRQFINSWMNRAQERGKNPLASPDNPDSIPNPFLTVPAQDSFSF